MSKSAPPSQKKRKLEDGMRGKVSRPKKKIRKQHDYHSSSDEGDDSESGFAPVGLDDSDVDSKAQQRSNNTKVVKAKPAASIETSEDESTSTEHESGEDSDAVSGENENHSPDGGQKRKRKLSKRNDPEAFSTSISKILSTKLSQSARKDPVLSRSRDAVETSMNIANERLEQRVRAKLRAEKKEDLQRGRIKDVLGVTSGQTGQVAEEEKRLRKIAQRGVVKLFNAVRAAQVRGEEAQREERRKRTIGHANKEEKVNEMSKQGFLELISGKKSQPAEAT